MKNWAEQAEISLELARDYFHECEELEHKEDELFSSVFEETNGPILELGAGKGDFTRKLLDDYIRPDGKLYAVERLEMVAEKLRSSISDPRLEVIISDSTDLPLPDSSVGMVISRVALHDFVSLDGDIIKALTDSARVLAKDGIFLIYDKITDGFDDVFNESAEARLEMVNVELAKLEGKKCWGLHESKDYQILLEELGFPKVESQAIRTPDVPGYVVAMSKFINDMRPAYVKRWGNEVHKILDDLLDDFNKISPRPLQMAFIYGRKA